MDSLTGAGLTVIGKNRQFNYSYLYSHFAHIHILTGYLKPVCLPSLTPFTYALSLPVHISILFYFFLYQFFVQYINPSCTLRLFSQIYTISLQSLVASEFALRSPLPLVLDHQSSVIQWFTLKTLLNSPHSTSTTSIH